MSGQADEVKAKTDIVALLGEYIELHKAGRNYKALCPFHGEKTPSFVVSPELQIYKCFGCGITGDVISFLEKYEGLEFYEALKLLAERGGVKLKPLAKGGESIKDKLYELNSLAAKFYHYLLVNHPIGKPALNYLLTDRGVTKTSIEEFELGFSPDSFNALQKFLIEKKRFKREDLLEAGLIVSSSGRMYDRFSGRIIFPLFDHRGNAVGIAGRAMPAKEKTIAKYINSPETPIYHKGSILYALNLTKGEIKKNGFALVVEGELDAIAAYQAGIKNVVAIKGSALTDDHVKVLSRFTQLLVLSLDSDLAGDTAARRGIANAESQGLEIRVVKLEKYKDPAEALTRDPGFYKLSLKNSVGVWDFIVDSVVSRNDAKTGAGKAKISSEIIPALASIQDKIVQAHYVEILADKIATPVDVVFRQLETFMAKSDVNSPQVVVTDLKSQSRNDIPNRRQLLEERLLIMCFQGDINFLFNNQIKKRIKTPLASRIVEELVKKGASKTKFDPSLFAHQLPSELMAGFAQIALQDVSEIIENTAVLEKEIKSILKEIDILDLKEKMLEITAQLSEAEKTGNRQSLPVLQKRFSAVSQKLSQLEVRSS